MRFTFSEAYVSGRDLTGIAFSCEENIAYKKTTDQVSTAYSGSSSRAVDGNSLTKFGSHSCTHTQKVSNPWWRVDVGQVEPVTEVYIVNRGDCCAQRLNSFEIRVGKLRFLMKFILPGYTK